MCEARVWQLYVRCFVAYDLHDVTESAAGKVSSESLPLCIKIMIQGPAPYFVAPTPGFDASGNVLGTTSLDDNGLPYLDRAEVSVTALPYFSVSQPLNLSLLHARDVSVTLPP